MELQPILDLSPMLAIGLSAVGALIVCAQAIVVLTPSKSDDHAWEKIKAMPILGHLLSILAEMAPIRKK